jgi:tetratricopeptide (TPR) repeat protein
MDTNKPADGKELMNKGWKAREALEFDESKKLLEQAKNIFASEGDWYNVTECLNHLVYLHKLRAYHENIRGIELAEESASVAQKHGSKDGSVMRAKMSIFIASGNYEEALKVAEKLFAKYDKTEKPLENADVATHLAVCKLRTGDITGAQKYVENALIQLDNFWDKGTEPHRSIWKVSALLTKGLVLFNMGKKAEAEKCGNDALKLAKAKDLKTRITQAGQFLALFDSVN